MNICTMNLNKDTCRSCLQTDTFLISIFDVYNNYSISKILSDVTGIMVRTEPDMVI